MTLTNDREIVIPNPCKSRPITLTLNDEFTCFNEMKKYYNGCFIHHNRYDLLKEKPVITESQKPSNPVVWVEGRYLTFYCPYSDECWSLKDETKDLSNKKKLTTIIDKIFSLKTLASDK